MMWIWLAVTLLLVAVFLSLVGKITAEVISPSVFKPMPKGDLVGLIILDVVLFCGLTWSMINLYSYF